ncbi:transposase [Alcaligenaceae bacterium]|nr:transposase [Alcaligenaceae bacterium]
MNYEPTKRRQRRSHSPQFKAQLVDQCLDGASLSAIAVDNGINPNLLRRWVLEHERLGLHALDDSAAINSLKPQKRVAPASWLPFVPVTSALDVPACEVVDPPDRSAQTSSASAQDSIRVDVAGNRLSLSVHWPMAQSGQLAGWVQELLA